MINLLGHTWGTVGYSNRKSTWARVIRKGIMPGYETWQMDRLYMGAAKMWANAITKSQCENEDSWWWENEVMLWTWEARWQLSSCYVGKGAFILRIPGVPRIHESHKDGLESRQKPRKSSIWASWTKNKAAPPLWWISSPNMLFILWLGWKFWGPSSERRNSGHRSSPGVPQTQKQWICPPHVLYRKWHEMEALRIALPR